MPKISDFPDADPLDGTELVPLIQNGMDVKSTIDDVGELLAAQIDANAVYREYKRCVTTPQSTTSTTGVEILELTQELPAGIYRLEGIIVWQSAATGTGAQFYLNCSGGTVSRVNLQLTYVTTATSTATGIVDGATTANQFLEGKVQRVNNTPNGNTTGVDTANADVMAIVEGVIIVTIDTTLQMLFNSEDGVNAVSVVEGSHLLIRRVA